MADLFRLGSFRLHSGLWSPFKIDCDALGERDWVALAKVVANQVGPFGAVEGVPTGGLALAAQLERYASDGPVLIVDDVLTTGGSMEAQRAGRPALGAVVFARGTPSPWIRPVFVLAPARPWPGHCPRCGAAFDTPACPCGPPDLIPT